MPPPPSPLKPEAQARVEIDAALDAAGWVVQDRNEMNLTVARGVAVREFRLKKNHGYASVASQVTSPGTPGQPPTKPKASTRKRGARR